MRVNSGYSSLGTVESAGISRIPYNLTENVSIAARRKLALVMFANYSSIAGNRIKLVVTICNIMFDVTSRIIGDRLWNSMDICELRFVFIGYAKGILSNIL